MLESYRKALLDFGASDVPDLDNAMSYLAGGVIARAIWMFSAPGAPSASEPELQSWARASLNVLEGRITADAFAGSGR
jgi:hypothetical protein